MHDELRPGAGEGSPAAHSPADLLAAVAADGLAGSALTLPRRPVGDRTWSSLLGLVTRHRLQGFLAGAIADGRMAVTDAQRCEATAAHVQIMGGVLQIERRVVRLAAHLDAAAIDHRVIKGLAVAHVDYPDPSLRATGDIDLLVAARDIERAVEVATAAGFARSRPQLRRGYDRRFAKAVTMREPGGGTWLDLHRTFADEPLGLLIATDDLCDGIERIEVGGRQLPIPTPEIRFLGACYNAALGDVPPRLVALRDVAQLLAGGRVDPHRVLAIAQRWQGLAVVQRAVLLAHERFAVDPGAPLGAWARAHRPAPAHQRRLDAHVLTGKRLRGRVLEAARALDHPLDQARYLQAVLLPDRQVLNRLGVPGYAAWWRRGTGAMREG